MADVGLEVEMVNGGIKTRLKDAPVKLDNQTKKTMTEALDREAKDMDNTSFAKLAESLADMSPAERDALFKLADRMGKKAR